MSLAGGILAVPVKLETERRAISRRIADCNRKLPNCSPPLTPLQTAPPTSEVPSVAVVG